MTPSEFIDLYNNREFDKLYPVIEKGFKIDFDKDGYANQASWSEDYELLYFLWKWGAKATTPFIEEVFSEYEKGVGFEFFVEKKRKKEVEKLARVKADLTEYTGADKFPFGTVSLYGGNKLEWVLNIHIEPYLYDGYVCEHNHLLYSGLFKGKSPRSLMNNKFSFADLNFDESIYIFNSHNRVDLESLEIFEEGNNIRFVAGLLFRWSDEGNGKDETFKLERTITKEEFCGGFDENENMEDYYSKEDESEDEEENVHEAGDEPSENKKSFWSFFRKKK